MHSATSMLEAGNALEASIHSATEALLGYRQADGHWVFELEADCTIPSEYVLLAHYLGNRPIPPWKPKSPTICGGFRAPMAAGRSCMTAIST